MAEFLVIGAGINGLLLARELAGSGARVTVLERGISGREASWAGGGIVSPLYPWRYGPAVTALATWAQDFYPALARELRRATGIDPELDASGLLMLDPDDAEIALGWAATNKRRIEPVDREFIYRHEPSLARGFARGLWMPQVANIRNPRLATALVADLRRSGRVNLREHSPLLGFRVEGGKVLAAVVGTPTASEQLTADRYIICTGAWSGELASQLGVRLPVVPVKGQMLLYRFPRAPVRSIILSGGRYAIPRRDGHLLVGSTLEYCGFDKTTSAEALAVLQGAGAAMLPELRSATVVAQWAGLRPGAPDGIPYIGRMPGHENLFVNAGQFRNGLVLAPASARLLADLLLSRAPIVDARPYDPVHRLATDKQLL